MKWRSGRVCLAVWLITAWIAVQPVAIVAQDNGSSPVPAEFAESTIAATDTDQFSAPEASTSESASGSPVVSPDLISFDDTLGEFCEALAPELEQIVYAAADSGQAAMGETPSNGVEIVWISDSPFIEWRSIGGSRVQAVVVFTSTPGDPISGNLYDYRVFSVGPVQDSGLTAPTGSAGDVVVCLAGRSAGRVEPASTDEAGTATATVTATPPGIFVGRTVRTTAAVNLRTAPGTTANIIGVLQAGVTATVIGGPAQATGYTWWQLTTPLGTGWVAGAFLTPAVQASTTPTRTSTPTPVGPIGIGDGMRVTSMLNLRNAPGTTAGIIAVMPVGTLATVIGGPQSASGFTWWRLSTPYGIGWAAGAYLVKVSSAASPTATPSPTDTRIATSTLTPTSTLSTTPSNTPTDTSIPTETGTPTETVTPSATATATETYTPSATTTETATPTPTATNTLTVTGTPPTETPTATFTATATSTSTNTSTPTFTPTPGNCGPFTIGHTVRTTTSLNLRTQPSTSATIITLMPSGTRGLIIDGPASGSGLQWCKLETVYGVGWSAANYLAWVSGPLPTPSGTQTPRPEPPPDPGTGQSALLYNGPAGSGQIALTYDAGADRGRAEYILDLLASFGVKATFGMTGTWAQANPDLVIRMVNEGHQIINHTWSHPSFTGASISSPLALTRSARVSQLMQVEEYILELTGYEMSPYWRPPYGDISSSVLTDVYTAGFYLTVMWSCDTLAWNGASESQILNRCMYPARSGAIILMHVGADGLDWAASDNMIAYFLANGYELVTIEEMFS